MKKCPIWKCLDFPDLWFDVKRWNKVKISDLKKIYREQLTKEKSKFFIKKTFFIEIYWKFIVSVCKCLPPVSPIQLMITLIVENLLYSQHIYKIIKKIFVHLKDTNSLIKILNMNRISIEMRNVFPLYKIAINTVIQY